MRIADLESDAALVASLPPPSRGTMYAIAFDLDTELLQQAYPGPAWRHGYAEMRAILEAEGFAWQQGSVYFGDASVDPVKCVLATQRLARELPWFTAAVRDMRMLRIEENNDLGPAVVPK